MSHSHDDVNGEAHLKAADVLGLGRDRVRSLKIGYQIPTRPIEFARISGKRSA